MTVTLLQIAIGGAAGAVARYLTDRLAGLVFGTHFPVGTLAVNLIGCLLMGIAFSLLPERSSGPVWPAPFIMTGVLGGYTTMSAYALDAWTLAGSGRIWEAFLYLTATVILAMAMLCAGIAFGRWIAG